MQIKSPTEFLTFSDGICDIYTVLGNKLGEKIMTLNFGRRVLGIKRFYAARAASTEIDRVIHVPMQLSITAAHNVVIGNDRYRIEQVQQLYDTNPPVTVLTLRKVGISP